jgi:hypothetical protein
VIGSSLTILIDRTDWKIFKEDYKFLKKTINKLKKKKKRLFLSSLAWLIKLKTLGLVSKLCTNFQVGPNNRNKIISINFRKFSIFQSICVNCHLPTHHQLFITFNKTKQKKRNLGNADHEIILVEI